MNSSGDFAMHRLLNALPQADDAVCCIAFAALALTDDRLAAVYDYPKGLRDLSRAFARMGLAAGGRELLVLGRADDHRRLVLRHEAGRELHRARVEVGDLLRAAELAHRLRHER